MSREAGIGVSDAIAHLRAALLRLPSATLDVDVALGRVLAAPIRARADLPGGDDAALDGVACRVADTTGATFGAPVALRLVGDASAGRPFAGVVGPGEAVTIATGALVPDGADGLVPVEDLAVAAGTVHVRRPASARDVRPRGQALAVGTEVLSPGRRLDAAALSLACAAGHPRVSVTRAPRVVILATGDELRPADTVALEPGERFESNGPGLAALAREAHAHVVDVVRVPDDPVALRAALGDAAASADLILTSGGVSMGTRDHVRLVMEAEGEIDFWRVAMKPGGPVLFGGWRGVPLLGLPGNPVASFVAFHVLVRPALQALEGDTAPAPVEAPWPARAGGHLRGTTGKVHYARVRLARDHAGWSALPFEDQSSSVLRSAVEADALAVVPPGVDLASGDPVDVLPWRLVPLAPRRPAAG